MLGRARKPLLLGVALVVALFATVLAVIGVALATTAGARMSLAAAAKLMPGSLVVAGVDGSIASGLVLTNVRYESPELIAAVGRIAIDARLGAVLERQLAISRIALENGSITLLESGSAAAEPTADPLALPVIPDWLSVRSLQVRNLELPDAGAALSTLDASVAGPEIRIDALDARVAGGRLAATGAARLGDEATARIDGSWTADAQAGAADNGDIRIELGADLEVATHVVPWRATFAWDRLSVEAAGATWSSAMGRLTSTPGAMPIEVALTAELESSLLPAPATVAGSARVWGSTVEIDELNLDTLGGRVLARGAGDFGALAGYAAVEFSMLDPSLFDPRVEGTFHGNLLAAFSAEPETVLAATGTLGGSLGGRPLDGALRASLRGGVANIDYARVVLEQSVIEIAGRVGEDGVDLTFTADVPELANWYPPAGGAVHASGTVVGPATDPTIDVDLRAESVVVETWPPLDELSLAVNGTLAAHDARAAARSHYGSLDVRVEQGWSNERLAGTVRESQLEVNRAGTWTLTSPAEYSISASSATLKALCYSGVQQASLCASMTDDTLSVEAAGMPSALAEPWLGGVELDGAADLALTLGWRPALHGSFTLAQQTLRMRQRSTADATEPAAGDFASIDDLRVTGNLTEQALDVRMTAALTATGDPLAAEVALAPPTAAGMLDASVSAQLTTLELVDALVEDVEQLTGSLALNLRATGSLDEPEVTGELAVRSVGAFVPLLGIEVSQGRLSARPVGLGALEISAAICSTGCVELDGSLDFGADGAPWRATATLSGESFALANLDDLRAVVATDLALDAGPDAWRVTGDLAVEEALAAVAAVPRSAVRPAPETVVHGGAARVDEAALPVPLVIDVDVRLGEVRFEGLGISAELDGLLDIARTADGQLLVNGTASIEQGTFSAYSQELQIERGDLLFAGPPDNPALDVRATREVEGATVGLAVTGTLRNPQSEVFSMPALTESEALARLVTGRSLESAGTADAEAIERAALGLGIRRALPALERIGDNLGLDELGVESGAGQDGALVAGRQLGDDVYLRYKYGLFDDFAGFELIYRITERFRLRTETGTSQSIDLLYERNRAEDAPLAETQSGFDDEAPRSSAAPENATGPQ